MFFTKAIGDQLTCIFVDHVLLRKGEAEQVMESLGGKFGLNIIKVDAKNVSYQNLLACLIQKKKRKSLEMNLYMSSMMKQPNLPVKKAFLSLHKETLYTDVIESGTETAQNHQITSQCRWIT
nr:DUF2501 domain-containing protein [Enterococcus faecium]